MKLKFIFKFLYKTVCPDLETDCVLCLGYLLVSHFCPKQPYLFKIVNVKAKMQLLHHLQLLLVATCGLLHSCVILSHVASICMRNAANETAGAPAPGKTGKTGKPGKPGNPAVLQDAGLDSLSCFCCCSSRSSCSGCCLPHCSRRGRCHYYPAAIMHQVSLSFFFLLLLSLALFPSLSPSLSLLLTLRCRTFSICHFSLNLFYFCFLLFLFSVF